MVLWSFCQRFQALLALQKGACGNPCRKAVENIFSQRAQSRPEAQSGKIKSNYRAVRVEHNQAKSPKGQTQKFSPRTNLLDFFPAYFALRNDTGLLSPSPDSAEDALPLPDGTRIILGQK